MNARHYNAEKLKRAREQMGATAVEVARALDVHKNTISRAETGVIVSFDLLSQLAAFYKKPVADFLHTVASTEKQQEETISVDT